LEERFSRSRVKAFRRRTSTTRRVSSTVGFPCPFALSLLRQRSSPILAFVYATPQRRTSQAKVPQRLTFTHLSFHTTSFRSSIGLFGFCVVLPPAATKKGKGENEFRVDLEYTPYLQPYCVHLTVGLTALFHDSPWSHQSRAPGTKFPPAPWMDRETQKPRRCRKDLTSTSRPLPLFVPEISSAA
jgi:hypothetical protein